MCLCVCVFLFLSFVLFLFVYLLSLLYSCVLSIFVSFPYQVKWREDKDETDEKVMAVIDKKQGAIKEQEEKVAEAYEEFKKQCKQLAVLLRRFYM